MGDIAIYGQESNSTTWRLAMIKGRHDVGRDPRAQAFFETIKSDGFTYKRFIDRIDLKEEVAG